MSGAISVFFSGILSATLYASAAVAVILLVRAALGNRLPAGFSFALWGIVLIRLLIPLNVPSPISLFSLLPRAFAAASASSPANVGIIGGADGPTAIFVSGPALPGGFSGGSVPSGPGSPGLWGVLPWIWIFGALLLFLYNAALYAVLLRSLRGTAVLSGGTAAESAARAGLKRPAPVLLAHTAVPLAVGFVRPRVVLPAAFAAMPEDTLIHILLHEFTHIKRGDVLLKLLFCAALCLHWFNPLVWLAFAFASRDMERACDARVLSVLGEGGRKPYAESLLRAAAVERGFPLSGGFLGFSESDTKGRVKRALRFKKPGFRAAAFSLALLCVCSVLLLTSAQDKLSAGLDDAGRTAVIEAVGRAYGLSDQNTVDVEKDLAIIRDEPCYVAHVRFKEGGGLAATFGVSLDYARLYFYDEGMSGYRLWAEPDEREKAGAVEAISSVYQMRDIYTIDFEHFYETIGGEECLVVYIGAPNGETTPNMATFAVGRSSGRVYLLNKLTGAYEPYPQDTGEPLAAAGRPDRTAGGDQRRRAAG